MSSLTAVAQFHGGLQCIAFACGVGVLQPVRIQPFLARLRLACVIIAGVNYVACSCTGDDRLDVVSDELGESIPAHPEAKLF